jgi:hypothetical protein
MVTDFAHSCSLVPVRMTRGGPVTWLRVYRAVPGALAFPFPHAFGSPVWITDYYEDHPPLGIQGPVPGTFAKEESIWEWASCKYPAPPGQHWHGPPEWFLDGIPSDAPDPGPRRDLCGVPLIDGSGAACVCGNGVMSGQQSPFRTGTVDRVHDGRSIVTISTLDTSKVRVDFGAPNPDTLHLTDDTCFRLTGVTPSGFEGIDSGSPGRLVILENAGFSMFPLKHESASALAPDRIITIDQHSIRLYPGYATWLQYDQYSSRWREVNTVPFIREPGDILTADPTGPVRLPVSTDTGHVLTARSTFPDRIGWGDGSGGAGGAGDINYHRHAVSTGVLPNRLYSGSYYFGITPGHTHMANEIQQFTPFISPRGGHIAGIAVYVAFGGDVASVGRLLIYRQRSGIDLMPDVVVASTALFDLQTTGLRGFDLDFSPDPTALYFLSFVGRDLSNAVTLTGWTTPPGMLVPLWGLGPTLDDFGSVGSWRILSGVGPESPPDPCPDTLDSGAFANLLVRIGVRYDG